MNIRKLTSKCSRSGGRNNQGVITVYHRGGANRRLYRVIDFKRSLFFHRAIVKKIEYDPNRTSKIALITYKKGILSYILAPKGLSPGDSICAGPDVEIATGNALPMGNMPVGTEIHNIELKPGQGGKLMRAAGTHAKIIRKDKYTVLIRLLRSQRATRKFYSIPAQAMATVGVTSEDKNIKLLKAGQSRWRGKRPVVRGVAMNPVDHPHGGGEGRSKGRHPVTP